MNEICYKVIFVIGAPGSGKNTICDSLIDKYKFVHFSAGELLRIEVKIKITKIKKGSPEGNNIQSIMQQGKLVPSSITCGLLKSEMSKPEYCIFIIDGYPRNSENIKAWEEKFANESRILCVLYLSCDLNICKKRLIIRSETSNRTDDQEEIIEKRFKGFLEENEQILNQMGKITEVIRIDSSKEKEKVFEEVCEIIDKII